MQGDSHNSDLSEALVRSLLQLKTRLHTQDEIAEAFGCGRNFVPMLLEHVPGVEWVGTGKRGRRVRLPLSQMPIDYLREVWPELVAVALLCTPSHESRSDPSFDLSEFRRVA